MTCKSGSKHRMQSIILWSEGIKQQLTWRKRNDVGTRWFTLRLLGRWEIRGSCKVVDWPSVHAGALGHIKTPQPSSELQYTLLYLGQALVVIINLTVLYIQLSNHNVCHLLRSSTPAFPISVSAVVLLDCLMEHSRITAKPMPS